jgi:hypothetical protein
MERHREQNERDGTNYPLPDLFDELGNLARGIALALVVVEDDKVLQGIYFEAKTVEMCFAGCDPRATAVARREIDATAYLLRQAGYELISCLVPKQVAQQIEKPLTKAGFERTDKLEHFLKDITCLADKNPT